MSPLYEYVDFEDAPNGFALLALERAVRGRIGGDMVLAHEDMTKVSTVMEGYTKALAAYLDAEAEAQQASSAECAARNRRNEAARALNKAREELVKLTPEVRV